MQENKPLPMQRILTDKFQSRFWSRVDRSGDCWNWKPCKRPGDYGSVSICKASYVAHRIAYGIATRTDPGEKLICHRCDNPNCVNPAHLFAGDHTTNGIDMVEKGRAHLARGRHVMAPTKLSDSMVQQIREMYATGQYSQSDLSDQFNVTKVTIGHVVKGLTWKDAGGAITHRGTLRGSDVKGALLNEGAVVTIRERYAQGGVTCQALADEYGISKRHLNAIINGDEWDHVGGPISKRNKAPRRLTAADVQEIRRLHATGEHTYASLAQLYNSEQTNISAIVRRKTWQHVS